MIVYFFTFDYNMTIDAIKFESLIWKLLNNNVIWLYFANFFHPSHLSSKNITDAASPVCSSCGSLFISFYRGAQKFMCGKNSVKNYQIIFYFPLIIIQCDLKDFGKSKHNLFRKCKHSSILQLIIKQLFVDKKKKIPFFSRRRISGGNIQKCILYIVYRWFDLQGLYRFKWQRIIIIISYVYEFQF